MNVVAEYVEVKQGFRIEINGTLMWETKTLEAAKGLTDLLNRKLADAYLEGHDDSKHGVMNVDNYEEDDYDVYDAEAELGLDAFGDDLDTDERE